MDPEYCDNCGDPLEDGQIGICDDCAKIEEIEAKGICAECKKALGDEGYGKLCGKCHAAACGSVY